MILLSILLFTFRICSFFSAGPPPTRSPTAAPSFAPTSNNLLTTLSTSFGATVSSPSQEFSWTISPSLAVSSIDLYFTTMSISSAELRIYNCSNDYIFFSCIQCAQPVPPPMTVDTSCILVNLRGVTGVSFISSTIAVQTFGRLSSISDATAVLSTFSISLPMGYGKIIPILAQNQLIASASQEWSITVPSSAVITMSLGSMNFDDSNSCATVLSVFDGNPGNLLYTACKTSDISTDWLVSTTGVARVKLTTSVTSTVSYEFTWFSDNNLYHCGVGIQPNTYVDNSMIISDGTKSNTPMRQSEGPCLWVLQPANAGKVTLLMSLVDVLVVNNNNPVIVYDSDFSTILWKIKTNNEMTTIPPILTSSGSTMYVVYVSGTSSATAGYQGFFGTYFVSNNNARGIGNHIASLKMSSALSVVPPGNGVDQYAGSLNYTWVVEPKTMNGVITFAFNSLSISDCSDVLTIYDGATVSATVIASFCGSATPQKWYSTTGSAATISFVTNSNSNAGIFDLAYFSDGPNYHCGFPLNPGSIKASSFTITDGSMSSEAAYSSQNCQWNIAPDSASKISIFFNRWSSSSIVLNVYDGSVTSGKLLVTIVSNEVPAPLHFNASSIGIVYSSSSSQLPPGSGFSLTYFSEVSDFVGPGNGLIRLRSAVAYSVILPVTSAGDILPGTNLAWIIEPTSSVSLYIAFSSMKIDCSVGHLNIYDGSSNSAALLGQFCGNPANWMLTSPFNSWVKSTSAVVYLEFISLQSSSDTRVEGLFELSYTSLESAYSCGFTQSPGVSTAPSFVMGNLQSSCEWYIDPSLALFSANDTINSSGNYELVLEFSGGVNSVFSDDHIFSIYDDNDGLIYKCTDCSVLPRIILTHTSRAHVRYTGTLDLTFVYYTLLLSSPSGDSVTWGNRVTDGIVLEQPAATTIGLYPSNGSAYFDLAVTSSASRFVFYPRYSSSGATDISGNAIDGRLSGEFKQVESQVRTCGVVYSNSDTYYTGSSESVFQAKMTQTPNKYLNASKFVHSVSGSTDVTVAQADNSPFFASAACKYHFDSGTTQAVNIQITKFTGKKGGRLVIYTGVSGDDSELAFDSSTSTLANGQGVFQNVVVNAQCGVANIFVFNDVANDGVSTSVTPNYVLDMSYSLDSLDANLVTCVKYKKSLIPVKKESDPLLPMYYALGGVFGAIVLYYLYVRFFPKDTVYDFKRKKRIKKIMPHPAFSPRLDNIRNRFLPQGTCCVCSDNPIRVLVIPKCTHSLCLECLKNYLVSALGDISTFPVKCPMHYEGCSEHIEAAQAKRVLLQPQYERFLEFHDRALYGEGCRCIFCNNFVLVQEGELVLSMVECPFCIQKFCYRCKKPWHYGGKCPLDTADDSLEKWKSESGAQKCPACHKMIEKSDPDTCNHMVHKITDGIPCIRERADFCYLCGEEVLPDYPHDEVANPGVNHFPDGVFQKCLKVMQREREAERERLKKIKRQRNNAKARMQARNPNAILPTTEGWDVDPDAIPDAINQSEVNYPAGANETQQREIDESWDIAGAIIASRTPAVHVPAVMAPRYTDGRVAPSTIAVHVPQPQVLTQLPTANQVFQNNHANTANRPTLTAAQIHQQQMERRNNQAGRGNRRASDASASPTRQAH